MKTFISFNDALDLTLSTVPIAGIETIPLVRLAGRVLSEDVVSKVDCPSLNTSLKDGYAVISGDITAASAQNPVKLGVIDSITAGSPKEMSLTRGQAIKITTGAPIPGEANAVLPEEFCRPKGDGIACFKTAETGCNILLKGTDIRIGEMVASKGEPLSPALIGLMASAGLGGAPVYKSPCVAVIATGDEVVEPGSPLPEGKLYASNMTEICSWLSLYGFPFRREIVRDSVEDIGAAITRHFPHADAFITTGGAWGSERDLIINVLENMNWQGIYHRVRMGPGKAVGFGLTEKKPFFCLPGGPTSSEMAFLQLALPGLMAMKGYHHPLFSVITGRLTETVRGDQGWTQFVHARIIKGEDHLLVQPLKQKSRLQSMARKEALIIIPEGCGELTEGERINVQRIPFMPLSGHFKPSENWPH